MPLGSHDGHHSRDTNVHHVSIPDVDTQAEVLAGRSAAPRALNPWRRLRFVMELLKLVGTLWSAIRVPSHLCNTR
ncbi:protein of unknown function (plasmid) [Agreia sp. COWG]|nr:protein of unknown function [Agreia sp. COWG]